MTPQLNPHNQLQNLDLSKPRALLNPLLPGKRVMAIIGFCDIHHFDLLVRRLGTEVRLSACEWMQTCIVPCPA